MIPSKHPVTRPMELLDLVDTPEGPLALRRRGPDELFITIAGRVLMSGKASRSEQALGTLGCAPLGATQAPRVLIGGLGLGCTLRATLDVLPGTATVVVAELNPQVVTWCRGPAATASGDALGDPRVQVLIADVAEVIARHAAGAGHERFHAILLDLYEGPHAATQRREDPYYGAAALARTRRALQPAGVLAVWSEEPDAAFEQRLHRTGWDHTRHRPGPGGRRHVVYVCRPAARLRSRRQRGGRRCGHGEGPPRDG